MKKILSIFLLLALGGCASVNIPNYIQDEHPYKQLFYAEFEKVKEATVEALDHFGWTVGKMSDPALFERERATEDGDGQQSLIFTEIREISFFLGTRYSRINVYLRKMSDGAMEVEIRCLKVTSVMFKELYGYKNDRAAERIFQRIEESLK